MLGMTGILVGAMFLTSIFVQTVLGFSALETGLSVLPLARAMTARACGQPPDNEGIGPRHRRRRPGLPPSAHAAVHGLQHGGLHHQPAARPAGPRLGIGLVFVAVSASAMAGIPAQHSGMASGFLMTGHEVGAALGVAILSAVAASAGSLATVDGAAAAFSRGFLGAAGLAAVVAVVAFATMPTTRREAGAALSIHH